MQKNLFISHKASRAIPFTSTVKRDFLIQTTLDGDVRRIEYQNNVIVDERIVPVEGIIVERFDGRFAVDIVDARPVHDPAAEALMQLAFSRKCLGIVELRSADVRAEPHCTAAREVWSHRAVRMRADDRAEILETLESGGPMGLAQLAGSANMRCEPRALVYALACEGAVELDLRWGLTDDMVIRSGRFGSSAALHDYGA